MLQAYGISFSLPVDKGTLFQTLSHHDIKLLIMITHEIVKVLDIPETEHNLIIQGALMHDLGKSVISRDILDKKEPLTLEERAIIENHPEIGAEMARSLGFPNLVIEMIWEHHENWDGSGYPRRLQGEKISLPARIMRVADHFNASQCHRRPWCHKRLSVEEVLERMTAEKEVLFDPQIVDLLPKIIRNQ